MQIWLPLADNLLGLWQWEELELLRLLPFNDEDATETESLIQEFDWIVN